MEKRFLTRFITISFFIVTAAVLTSYTVGTGQFPLGNDLAGGANLIYRLDPTEIKSQIAALRKIKKVKEREGASKEEIDDISGELTHLNDQLEGASNIAQNVIQKRVDPSGTTGVVVRKIGGEGVDQRVQVTMPKATPAEMKRIRDNVEKTGNLRFHRVLYEAENADTYRILDQAIKKEITDNKEYDITQEDDDARMKAYRRLVNDLHPIERKLTKEVRHQAGLTDEKKAEKLQEYEVKLILKPPTKDELGEIDPILIESRFAMQGNSIKSASWRLGDQGPQVNINFNNQGAIEFGELTRELTVDGNDKKRMAIVLDGTAYSAPNILEPILQGNCRISGRFDPKEAESLTQVLQTGSLPMTPELISMSVTGPTLGREAIRRGIRAIIIAGVMVLLFMFFYYRKAGMVANLALIINLILLMGVMCFVNAHMTMPGIAGILLTVGMSVDANVLIFERIREEAARGRTFKIAIQHGFDRALVTILDANITTFLTGMILYYFGGAGPVKGFATTLMLGIITSLFSALIVSRALLEWLVYDTEKAKARGSMLFVTTVMVIWGIWIVSGKSNVMQSSTMVFGLPAHVAWGLTLIVSGLVFPGILLWAVPEGKRVDSVPPGAALLGGVLSFAAIAEYAWSGEKIFQYAAMFALAVGIALAATLYFLKRSGLQEFKISSLFVLNRTFNFMGVRSLFAKISAIVVGASLVVFLISFPNLKGIQFTGGTQLTFSLKPDKTYDIGDIRKKFNGADHSVRDRVLTRSEQVLQNLQDVLAEIDAAKNESAPAVAGLSTTGVPVKTHYTVDELSEYFSLSETHIVRAIFPKEDVAVSRLAKYTDELEKEINTRLKNEKFTVISYGMAGENRYRVTNRLQNPILGNLFQEEIRAIFKDDLINNPMRLDLSSSMGILTLSYNTRRTLSDDEFEKLVGHTLKKVADSTSDERDKQMILAAVQSITISNEKPASRPGGIGTGRIMRFGPLPTDRSGNESMWSRFIFELTNISEEDRDMALDVKPFSGSEEIEKRTVAELKNAFSVALAPEPIPGAEAISSDVSGDLQIAAAIAILLSLVVIFLYIFMRFDFSWAYGAGAVIALFHDVTITLGAIAVAHWILTMMNLGGMLITLDTIAAILTIIGYSLNDTIVVFDRIREMRRAHRTRDIAEIINDAINQCLSRTLLTSITTLLSVFFLLVLGGQDLRGLAFALFIGVIVGTYSSIFIASPTVVYFLKRSKKKAEEDRSGLVKVLTQS